MEMSFGSRLKHAWNAFTGNVQTNYRDLGMSYSYRADRPRMSRGNERSIVTSVYNRIALDVAALNVQHVRLDENGRFLSVIDDGLNNCLTLEANVDQTARSFIQDVVISMFDEGSVAIVPVDTTTDPNVSGSYDIQSLRVGQILDWYPQYIRARVYNEQTGRKEDIVVPKSAVAIIENPLYAVINEPNSTMQRLIRKLNLLDVIDEQSGSGKLDLIIQLPYVIKTEARRQQAENRRKDIENQLSGSKYGIAYTDGTEHITQLNRSVNNNLMSQIEYLTSMLYSQLGITQSILDGTADEKTMESVRNNTIKFVKGNPSSAPSRPTLTNEGNVHQYPLCYIYRKYGAAVINQADITPMVGTESTPFVTGILQTISLDELLGKWQDELDRFTDARSQEVDDWIAQEESDFTAWFDKMKADLQQEQNVLDQWIASEQADFLAWYNQMKDQLSGDVAGNLQLEIDKEEVKRILLVGFEDGTKEFSDDGTVITSTASDGRTLTKTFSDGFLTMTNVLKSAAGAEVARAVKTFDSDGKLISTVVTYS